MTVRKRGSKLPTNFIKVAILLFIADTKKSSTEIREHLKQIHNVKESRGIRKHLTELYNREFLDKNVEIGIGSYYTWKKSFDSFKKIINFLTKNTDVIRQVEIENNKDKEFVDFIFDPPSKFTKPLSSEQLKFSQSDPSISEIFYQMDLKDTRLSFNSLRYWFNTNYTISMINQKFVRYFINKAYEKCKKNFQVLKSYREEYHTNITKKIFLLKCLEAMDVKILSILMRHSPSLILYIINLDENFQDKMIAQRNPPRIFHMVTKDMFSSKFHPHEQENKNYGFKKLVAEDGKFNGVYMFFKCNLGTKNNETDVKSGNSWRKKN